MQKAHWTDFQNRFLRKIFKTKIQKTNWFMDFL